MREDGRDLCAINILYRDREISHIVEDAERGSS